jgi:hypothetical protein
MTRLARILALVTVLALGLSPLAPFSAYCAGQDRSDAAATAKMAMDMPCCPDEAPEGPINCMVGCIQLPAVIALAVAQPASLGRTFAPAIVIAHIGWLVPPATEPPRLTSRI